VRRNNLLAQKLKDMGASIVVGNLSQIRDAAETIRAADIVYHLAGSVFSKNKKELFQVNCEGTSNLYGILKGSRVKKFIYLSSIAAVGPSAITRLDETMPSHPISHYGESKRAAEAALKEKLSEVQKDIVIIRCPLIYGEDMNEESRLKFLKRKIANNTFCFIGRGDNLISLCYVKNLVLFLVQLLTMSTSELDIFHIADAASVSFKALVWAIADTLNVPRPQRTISPVVAYIIGLLGEGLGLIFHEKVFLTRERMKEVMNSWDVDVSKALSFGYRPQQITLQQLGELAIRQ